jgi:GNAT superfamily N-acetyltransferase
MTQHEIRLLPADRDKDVEGWLSFGNLVAVEAHDEPEEGVFYSSPVPSRKSYILEVGGEFAGAVSVGMSGHESTANVPELAVADDYRGKGYGLALMSHVEEVAMKHGHNEMRVTPGSDKAYAFYEHIGYLPVPGSADGDMFKMLVVPTSVNNQT